MLAKPKQKAKISMDIEALVRWAYVDELSKRQSSSAEGMWKYLEDYSNHGGVDNGHGAAQRYCHFGLPDADAERIEKAVGELKDVVIDWNASFYDLAGDLAGLISINDLSPQNTSKQPKAGWGKAGNKALNVFFGNKGTQPAHDRPRDVLMLGGLKSKVLVTTHAIKGTRPEWREDEPEPHMVPSHGRGGTIAAIVGECRGKNLYSTGSYCPLSWSPSPLSIVSSRIEYFAWYEGLIRLYETLLLDRFEPLPPKAPQFPWICNNESRSNVIPVMPTGHNDVSDWGILPLLPVRPRAGYPR